MKHRGFRPPPPKRAFGRFPANAVGPVRRYTIGVDLLDKEDPSRVIARLDEPILIPEEHERDGYVPNVAYSCGAMVHNDQLLLRAGNVERCRPERSEESA